MQLFIAEKPSLARAIADALPKPHKRAKGYIQCGQQTWVTWCVGHLLEQANPEVYHPQFKRWQLSHLPIVPQQWILCPRKEVQTQLDTVISLIQKATSIVHAGDPDREGQLLVDEVLNHAQLPKEKLVAVKRCLITDLTPNAVAQALEQLKLNSQFIPLSSSALARARADWLYGINMSRLCTLKGQQQGYKGVLSIGRVQTPILGLIVRRDLEIAHFQPKPFYEVLAHLVPQAHSEKTFAKFTALWQPSEACEPYQDEEKRIVSLKLAENVATRITQQEARVTQYSEKQEKELAPLPYALSDLQIEAARLYGMKAQNVLDTAQRLYEIHKLITYPRTDCGYLPELQFQQRQTVFKAIAIQLECYANLPVEVDISQKNRCWNDQKVEAHHGIIPTANSKKTNLSVTEQQLYQLIVRRYIMQFCPDALYSKIRIQLNIAGGVFIAQSRGLQQIGWKVLLGKTEQNEQDKPALPRLKKGEWIFCEAGEVLKKQTQPPRHFSDATLMSAITGIARFVQDKEIKKILRETDGIGTEATRAGIIELLFKRNYLTRKGRQIHATDIGRKLILSLPAIVTQPDMTAYWEHELSGISKKETRYQEFMQHIQHNLNQLIALIQRNGLNL